MAGSGEFEPLRLTSPFCAMATRVVIALVSLCCLSLASLAEGVGSESSANPAVILDTLGSAGRELDYRGVFTYEYAGALKSVEVTHIARGGVEHERWFYLNGPRQEIVRQGPFCGGGEDSLERVTRPAINRERMSGYYDLQLWGEDRIADRPVWVLHLAPRDVYRYGFVFAIDKDSGLLLQSLLLDSSHRVLERFQFMSVDYSVDGETARELMVASSASTGARRAVDCASHSSGDSASGWQAGWLPPGFRLLSQSRDADDIESLLFSDGLAVFSIFFDARDSEKLPEVQAQRGATVAQLTRIEAEGRYYLVSVVGEIPLETAQRVAGFVRYGARE